ncbi:cytochrome aa3 quinol oxidase subunit II [Salirhabdus salicampi]|uniref:cytochrome aa3 quinol oxidase subunit II n=1 Tax=Salirhabdus salicampi TaxID=476102 RepID=UPI0020C44889|nr:cytochrome aa3 quinol oxidase subunit II [Salirhabdus salicampi]MCP8615935.1 cytochrome aa3 quinol oxidase subunit II [Salirhabdus salicampi]
MKKKWALLSIIFLIATFLTGCEPLTVLDPKGPQAETTRDVIMISIWTMLFIVVVVFALLIYVLIKYRASNQSEDYEPPHIHGSKLIEGICVGVPIIIVIFLSVITVKSTYEVESTPKGFEDEEPLIIYVSSSEWKWHFSYPEENIETVNYLYIPTNRPIEFKLFSHGSIASFWVPQLAGQKYAMANMINTLHVAATVPGDYVGRNANFNGEGFAHQTFNVTAMEEDEFQEWVEEVHATADPITIDRFEELLEPGHLGQLTFTGTHLDFLPPPSTHHGASHGEDSEEHNEDHSSHDSHDDSGH